jgi:hypothetical protein
MFAKECVVCDCKHSVCSLLVVTNFAVHRLVHCEWLKIAYVELVIRFCMLLTMSTQFCVKLYQKTINIELCSPTSTLMKYSFNYKFHFVKIF